MVGLDGFDSGSDDGGVAKCTALFEVSSFARDGDVVNRGAPPRPWTNSEAAFLSSLPTHGGLRRLGLEDAAPREERAG